MVARTVEPVFVRGCVVHSWSKKCEPKKFARWVWHFGRKNSGSPKQFFFCSAAESPFLHAVVLGNKVSGGSVSGCGGQNCGTAAWRPVPRPESGCAVENLLVRYRYASLWPPGPEQGPPLSLQPFCGRRACLVGVSWPPAGATSGFFLSFQSVAVWTRLQFPLALWVGGSPPPAREVVLVAVVLSLCICGGGAEAAAALFCIFFLW